MAELLQEPPSCDLRYGLEMLAVLVKVKRNESMRVASTWKGVWQLGWLPGFKADGPTGATGMTGPADMFMGGPTGATGPINPFGPVGATGPVAMSSATPPVYNLSNDVMAVEAPENIRVILPSNPLMGQVHHLRAIGGSITVLSDHDIAGQANEDASFIPDVRFIPQGMQATFVFGPANEWLRTPLFTANI